MYDGQIGVCFPYMTPASDFEMVWMPSSSGFACMAIIRALGLLLWISALTPWGCVHGLFNPVDNYLIDCGSSVDTTIGSRTFVADKPASWTLSTPQTILANTTSNSVSSFDSAALYQTARIFTGSSSYTIPIQNQGRHWIRLYFFPFKFQGFNLTTAEFSVSTQEFVLLRNFQAPNGSAAMFKEYSANITSSNLILSFIPSGNSTAFINAIEVVSVPDGLFSDAQAVDPSRPPLDIAKQALETVYRINMGGPKVVPMNDTLTRTWIPDEGFLLERNAARSVVGNQVNYGKGGATQETAPASVYRTATAMAIANVLDPNFNVTWEFPVDANFSYLVRFHFCDIVSIALNQLYFNVYINRQAVAHNLDLSSATSNVLAMPYFMDFVAAVGDGSGKFRISIGPSTLPNVEPNAILNGLEIMKVNNSLGSLDGQVPVSDIKHPSRLVLISTLGALGVVILVLGFFMVLRRWKLPKERHSEAWGSLSVNGISHSSGSRFTDGTQATISSGQKTNLGFRFSLAVVQEATNNFDENWVIGVGGFGKVFKGVLRDETKVAVKRGNPRSQQGFNEFRTEIELLSQLRHRHLVSLIGYCDEQNEMILVYEYMKNGTLKSHLYGSNLPTLSWKQRLEICIGAARGLHYLHTGQAKAVIHRDVKSANILLDENLMAKVADFGLSKTGPELDQSHVSTAVKGSFGYLDPEYFRRQQLTEKSDVYSFGVVLLEVLCARTVIDPTLPREMVNLAEWAMDWQKKDQLKKIIDPRLAGTIRSDSLRKFGEMAGKCLADYGVDRPSMADVLWNLEYVLQLQEEVVSTFPDMGSVNGIPELASRFQNASNLENVDTEELASRNDLSDASSSGVFSQLIKAEGR
uniref:Receptor-like protein kinase HERK 1 n=1 Tax=Anthurium amnicola TaxID=1678845 RepID=A0A1D1XSH7_9ARAE